MAFETRVFIVQTADEDGRLDPEPIAVKLNFDAAHAIAKAYAPAKVTALVADKSPTLNGPGRIGYQGSVRDVAPPPQGGRFAPLHAKPSRPTVKGKPNAYRDHQR